MSNWIDHTLTVCGEEQELQRFIEEAQATDDGRFNPLSFTRIAPLPTIPNNAAIAGLSRQYCWGCDCESLECERGFVERGERHCNITYRFKTRNSPCLRAVLTVSRRFNLEFTLCWMDYEGGTTGGEVTIRNGLFVGEQHVYQILYDFIGALHFSQDVKHGVRHLSDRIRSELLPDEAEEILAALEGNTHFHLMPTS